MRPTEPFRQEHEQLLEHIAKAAREMPRPSDEERAALRERILAFLRGTLVPHAKAEEEALYPLISVHFRKEEDLRLSALDSAPPAITEAVIARMERATGDDHGHSASTGPAHG